MSKSVLGTSYFGCRAPEYVRKDMEYLKNCGITEVLHTCSEDDYHFYRENMKEIVQASHENGLSVYFGPWGAAGVFGGEAFSKFLLMNQNDWQVVSDGKKYPAACLNSKKLKDFMYSWVDLAAESGADAVFWDEPHWFLPFLFVEPENYHLWGCRCDTCKALYKIKTGSNMPDIEDISVKQFKLECLNDFLFELSNYAKTKELKVAVCLLPSLETEDDYRHWDEIAACPSIDILSTDPYWAMGENGLDSHYKLGTEKFVAFFAEELVKICKKHSKKSMLWIQNFRIYDNEDKVKIAAKIAKQSGVDKIFSWGFKGSQYMSFLRCMDSDTVWSNFINGGKE